MGPSLCSSSCAHTGAGGLYQNSTDPMTTCLNIKEKLIFYSKKFNYVAPISIPAELIMFFSMDHLTSLVEI